MNEKQQELRDKLWAWYKEAGKEISLEWALNELQTLYFSRMLKMSIEINKKFKED